jgi:hypothetical protein
MGLFEDSGKAYAERAGSTLMVQSQGSSDSVARAHKALAANLRMAKGFQTLHLCFSEIVRDDLRQPEQTKDYLPILLFIGYKLSDLASGFTPEAERHDIEFFQNLANDGLLDLSGSLTPHQQERMEEYLVASWYSHGGRKDFWFPSAEELAQVSLAIHRGLLPQAILIAVSGFEGYLKDITGAAVLSNTALRKRFYDEIDRRGGSDLARRILDNGPEAYAGFVAELIGTPTSQAIHHHFQKLLGTAERFCSPGDELRLDIILEYRHLIAHRTGIVDAEFKFKTNCPEAVGQPVSVTRELVSESIVLISGIASKIQDSVERALKIEE